MQSMASGDVLLERQQTEAAVARMAGEQRRVQPGQPVARRRASSDGRCCSGGRWRSPATTATASGGRLWWDWWQLLRGRELAAVRKRGHGAGDLRAHRRRQANKLCVVQDAAEAIC